MIELLLDFLLQLLLYLLRMPILNYLEKLISCLFSSHKKPSLDVLHKSDNFIIVNKPFDILINSDDSKVKVSKYYPILSFKVNKSFIFSPLFKRY